MVSHDFRGCYVLGDSRFNISKSYLRFVFKLAPFLLQDLADNPQYSLIIEKGRFAEKYFSSSDPVKNPEAAILWDRIMARPASVESDMNLIEKELLNNPKSVFFGPVLATRLRFNSIPCYVEASSGSLYKVSTM